MQQCRFRRCLISLEAGCYCTQEIWRPHLLSFRVGPTGLRENLSTASMSYKRAKSLGPICANFNDVSKRLKHGPNCPHGCRGFFCWSTHVWWANVFEKAAKPRPLCRLVSATPQHRSAGSALGRCPLNGAGVGLAAVFSLFVFCCACVCVCVGVCV